MASHVGVEHLKPDPYNLSDDEIREIARRGGAIGVIFLTYWLDKRHPKKGLDAIWRDHRAHPVANRLLGPHRPGD